MGGGKEQVFGWGGMGFVGSMLGGRRIGGVLGQIDLAIPYIVRSVLLGMCFVLILIVMRDIGFTPRPLEVSRFGQETRAILKAGVEYGWRHRVVRPLMFVSLAQGLFFIYGFYSLQPYLLQLLERNLVWAVAAVTAVGSLMGIVGNSLVGRIMKGPSGPRRSGRVLALVAGVQAAMAVAIGLTGLVAPAGARGPLLFALVTVLWMVFSFGMGVTGPVRAAYLNTQIPSAQRATVLSLDSFFADVGGSVGQPGLGWIAQATSIPLGWVVGAVAMAAAVPLYLRADTADREAVTLRPDERVSGERAEGE